jgi:hypothetical protein
VNLRPLKISSMSRPNTERGIALITVLWVLLLLSALAASASYVVRTNAIVIHRDLESARLELAAEAAIVEALSRLSDERVNRHPALHDADQHWEFEGIRVVFSVSKESGRIDVNTAQKELLLAFLYAQGVSSDTAESMLNDLQDRIDSPRTIQIDGARIKTPLQSTEELRAIPSWRAQPLDCWMDALTVYTGLPGVSSDDAVSMVVDTLALARDRLVGGRAWSAGGNQRVVTDQSLVGEILRISARATLSSTGVATATWVGRLTGNREHPTMTVRWDHGALRTTPACKKIV